MFACSLLITTLQTCIGVMDIELHAFWSCAVDGGE